MKPISFVSKSLNFSQLNWSTIQKEAYAIFLCCTKLDPLLRDRKFTIHTDHRNLTYMKSSPNSMVGRWSIALQELDYTIAYVRGSENTVADAMSRLCANLSDLVIKVQPATTGTEPDNLPGPFSSNVWTHWSSSTWHLWGYGLNVRLPSSTTYGISQNPDYIYMLLRNILIHSIAFGPQTCPIILPGDNGHGCPREPFICNMRDVSRWLHCIW